MDGSGLPAQPEDETLLLHLPAGQPRRHVMYELDVWEAVHAEDWEVAQADIDSRRNKSGGLSAAVVEPIGMDCAKRLGLEFSRR